MQFIPTKDKISILTKLKLRTNLDHSSGHSTSITLGSELLICRKVILILTTRKTLYNQKKKEKKNKKHKKVSQCMYQYKPLCIYRVKEKDKK